MHPLFNPTELARLRRPPGGRPSPFAPSAPPPAWAVARAADPGPGARSAYWGVALLVLLSCLVACADIRLEPPQLQPLSPVSVQVSETLRLPLAVNNPDGVSLQWAVVPPDLPGIEEVTSLSGGLESGEFRFTPLASHVGTHEFTFEVRSAHGRDAQSLLVTVTPDAGSGPVFLRPGVGGTYDLGRDPCVRFDVEVRDDDSPEVAIRLRGQPIDGAVLEQTGPKQARFEWCPAPQQVDLTDRWTVGLEADDGFHPPTRHDYLVVLRRGPRENCPGEPPEVTVLSPQPGERVTSSTGYRVTAEITDDLGIRDAPLLYYTTTTPEDPAKPDVTEFSQAVFTSQGDDLYQAVVPPLGLQAGQERIVYFIVSAKDNDDPTGTACDHRTDTPLREFVAVGGAGELGADCELCMSSEDCASGLCAASGGGVGVCLPPCVSGDSCGSGSCQGTRSVEGSTLNACGDAAAYCEGGDAECVEDEHEPNDSMAAAPSIGVGATSAVYCWGNPDYFRITASQEGEVEVVLTDFDPEAADLDLELLAADGRRLANSAGIGDTETVWACVESGDHVFAHVYSVIPQSSSPYTLHVSQTPGSCCVKENEPGSLDSPVPIPEHGNFVGTICPGDVDHHGFTIDGPSRLEAIIVFEHDEADLDLELFGPQGNMLASSYGLTDEEEIVIDLGEAGDYVLRVYAFDNGASDYLGQIALTPLECVDTVADCPVWTVCDGGDCVVGVGVCTEHSHCPPDHLCVTAGPDWDTGDCVAPCTANADCRDEGATAQERCKWFLEGRGCGVRGSGANGDACEDFADCGGQRACHTWPAGYCARIGCVSDADCESDTFCAGVGGQNLCVRTCEGPAAAVCRAADGYVCSGVTAVSGDVVQGCVPGS